MHIHGLSNPKRVIMLEKWLYIVQTESDCGSERTVALLRGGQRHGGTNTFRWPVKVVVNFTL